MQHKKTLETAIELLDGDREDVYGNAFDQHSRIATFWSAILGYEVTEHQVALCMAGMKLSRAIGSPLHEDSFVDMAAYAALAGEFAEREQQRADGAFLKALEAHPASGTAADDGTYFQED